MLETFSRDWNILLEIWLRNQPWKESKVVCPSRGCTFEIPASLHCLVDHCQKVHDWKEIPCSSDNCNYVAYSDTSIASHHTRFHSKHRSFARKEFPCTWKNCKSSFTYNADLLKHLRIHTNSLLACVFCPYRTNRDFEMKSHYRSHFKMFDFKCENCDRIFVSRKHLNNHFTTKHSDENYTCHICKAYTGPRPHLQDHIKYRHKFLTKWNEATKTFDTFCRE